MIARFDNILNKGVSLYKNKWLRIIAQLIILGVCALYVYRYSNEIMALTKDLDVNFFRIILAWLVLSIVYIFIGTSSWWCILKGLGEAPNWIDSAQIQMNSTLAKYIPGYVWQYVGKAIMSKEIGIGSGISGIAMTFELFQTILVGIGFACIAFSIQNNQNVYGFSDFHEVALPLGILIVLAAYSSVLIIPRFIPRALKINTYRLKYLFASLALITVGWIMLSTSFWVIGTSLSPSISAQDLPTFMLSTSMAMVGGILLILVPNGLGVREGIMVVVLGNIIGVPLAIMFAVITRLFVTVCELTSAFIVSYIHRNFKRRKADIA